jgi:MFS family permease
MRLAPDPRITPQDAARGRRAMVQDAAWASLVGALYSGVIMVGFALAAGASPFIIGLLAAIPLAAQLAQVPAILLVERVRQRRKIAVISVSAARLLILALALLPLLGRSPALLVLLICAEVAITLLGAFVGCAVNSWYHQLLAGEGLGALFAKRLFWSTVLASLGAFAAGNLVEHWPFGDKLDAYSVVFAIGGIGGFLGVRALMQVPEPPMLPAGPPRPILQLLGTPFRDANFRRLITFMASWSFASNLAAPFLTVYLLQQMRYGLGTVTALWALNQIASALTLYAWGRLSDRMTNKAVLATALPVYFACLIALPFSALPEPHALTLPLLVVIHVAMGIASGGVSLASGNIGLKLAPAGSATAYLASVTLSGSLAGGVAAIAGGALAEWFALRKFSLVANWSAPGGGADFVAVQFRHWEFLFALSFLLGFYVLHALSRIVEGDRDNERSVMRDFLLEAGRGFEQMVSTAASSAASVFPFGRLFDRRRRGRGTPFARPQE